MEKKQNVPALRFQGFSGEWERSFLKEVTKRVIVGLATSVTPYYRTSGTPILRNLNIKENYLDDSDILFLDKVYAAGQTGKHIHTGDVLTVHTGYIGTSCVVPQKYNGCLTFTTLITTTNDKKLRGEFFSQYLNTPMGLQNVQMVTTQGGRQNLNTGDFVQIKVPYPSLGEQIRLEKFLKGINQVIWKRQHKIKKLQQFRQAMLTKIFPREGAAEPELRFRGFSGKWKQKKLGNLVARITRKNSNMESDLPLTISAVLGLVSQREYFNNRVASGDVSRYYLIKKGEFAYNKSYSDGYPFGAVKRLEKYDKGVLSTLYIIFSPKKDAVQSDYLAAYYDTMGWYKEVAARAAEGARNHGLLNISPDDFFDTMLKLPESKEEQQQIGTFFKNLDDFIFLQKKKLERMRRLKAALLEKMFV